MAASAVRKLTVDVTSDTICPFCILGVKQLQVAADRFSAKHPEKPVQLDLRFHPFQLSSGAQLGEKAVSRRDYSSAKFGPERTAAFAKMFDQKYREVGLDGFAEDAQLASSHLGHRLTAYAQAHKPEEATPLALDLMNNYQVRGKSPSDRDELARIAVKHGLFDSADKAKAWLASDDLDAQVRKQYLEGPRNGVSGVPHFVFDNKYVASGAVGIDEFESALEQITAAQK